MRYQTLLKGLEIAEIQYSTLNTNSKIFRMDSEPFQKFYNKKFVIETLTIDEICKINPSKKEIKNVNSKTLVSFLPMAYMKKGFIDHTDTLEFNSFNNSSYSYFSNNDILLAKITPCMEQGKCAIATDLLNNIGFGSTEYNVFRVTNNRIKNNYLFAYLNRECIRKQAQLYMVGTSGRQRVPTEFYRKLKVPVFSISFQDEVSKLITLSYRKRSEHKEVYEKAENLVLSELNFDKYIFRNNTFRILSFSDSFGNSNRLDAEYYQEKYILYSKMIKEYKNGFDLLGKICRLYDSSVTPKNDDEYNYIELSDIGSSGYITSCTSDQGKNLPSRARRRVSTNNVIVSSVEGSLSSCAIISKKYDQALCSTGFYVISSEKINSETLLVLFKSEPIQQLLKKGCSGTILTAINKNEFLKIPIPLIENEIQNKIRELIKESNLLIEKSNLLLEQAKAVVELAIEQGEEIALNYLKQSTLI